MYRGIWAETISRSRRTSMSSSAKGGRSSGTAAIRSPHQSPLLLHHWDNSADTIYSSATPMTGNCLTVLRRGLGLTLFTHKETQHGKMPLVPASTKRETVFGTDCAFHYVSIFILKVLRTEQGM